MNPESGHQGLGDAVSPDADPAQALEGADERLPTQPYRLTEEQIQQITDRLRSGAALPPYLLPHLFERPREYELTYAGKMRQVDVIAETMALPLQPVKTFGSSKEDWTNQLILGDNLQVLRSLLRMKEAGKLKNQDGTPGVRLVYIDPPFATQREFRGKQGEQAFEDRVGGAEFIEYLRRRLILIRELLASDGSLYVHLDQKKVHYIKVVLDEIFGEANFRNEIVWKRTTSHSDAKRFGVVHETILFYRNGTDTPFTAPLVPLDEQYVKTYYRYEDADGKKFMSADLSGDSPGPPRSFGERGIIAPPRGRHWAYNQEGIDRLLEEDKIFFTRNGVPRRKIFLSDSEGMPAPDVWDDILPIVSWSKERTNFPTQKPQALLDRIITSSSNPGDIVLDCFAGSGTTLMAAQTAESGPRRWIGVDCGKFAIYTSQARLLRLLQEDGTLAFTTYNAGLYDYEALRSLDWEEYRRFALSLFQCRDEPQRIGGFSFDGMFLDDPVSVFNFKAHPEDVRIGLPLLEDIAEICGGQLGDRCFIIAPALSVEPYEDYIDLGGTRFFFLRIPYSVIAELHKRAFSELRQPTSEALANTTIDATGFDFIRPPRVVCSFDLVDDELLVVIREFESQAYAADDSGAAIDNLAMVMVDFDYDSEVFDLDAVYYADSLSPNNWSFTLPAGKVGAHLMFVYLDIYGNELREIKSSSEFGEFKKDA